MIVEKRQYVENNSVVLEMEFDWSQIIALAEEQHITKEILADSFLTSLYECLQENIDIDELFCEFLENLSEEK